jgi:hypothetical protein
LKERNNFQHPYKSPAMMSSERPEPTPASLMDLSGTEGRFSEEKVIALCRMRRRIQVAKG